MFLVGITGAAGSGKDSVADVLVQEFGGVKFSFADPIRDMLKATGVEDECFTDRKLKETPHPLLGGRTPRYAMRSLGTEWGQYRMSRDIWAKILEGKISEHWRRFPTVPVIVPDVRFYHEAALFHRNSGYLVQVRRPDVEPSFSARSRLKRLFTGRTLHVSELLWRKIPVDFTIHNEGTKEDLHRKLTDVTRRVRDRAAGGTPVPYLREVAA